MPVIASDGDGGDDGGLIGKVESSTGNAAIVTPRSPTHSIAVSARTRRATPASRASSSRARATRRDLILQLASRKDDTPEVDRSWPPPARSRRPTTWTRSIPPRHPDRPRHAHRRAGHRQPARPHLRPFVDLRRVRCRPGADQEGRTTTADGRRHAPADPAPGLLGIVVVVLQVAAVSQVVDLRHQRRPHAARRRGRRPAVRLDHRRAASASPSGCSSTSRWCRRSGCRSLVLRRGRLLAPGACASCATRRPRSSRWPSARRPRRSRRSATR